MKYRILDKEKLLVLGAYPEISLKEARKRRDIFKKAFTNAGVKYYLPHTLRHILIHHYQAICKTPEEFKAISQNLGYESLMTTFTSCGEIPMHRQMEIIKNIVQES